MTVPPGQQLPPIERLCNGQILIRAQAAIDLDRLVRAGRQALRSLNGADVAPRFIELAAQISATANEALGSAVPHPEPRKPGHLSLSPPDDLDLITSEEAGALLGVSARYVRDVPGRLDGRWVGGRWLFPRKAVAEYARTRKDDLDEQAQQAVEGGG
jgi:hypothetical protein